MKTNKCAPAERASAAGLANLPSQATQSVSTYVAGYLMEYVALTMPLLVAGGLRALNALLYYVCFIRCGRLRNRARYASSCRQ